MAKADQKQARQQAISNAQVIGGRTAADVSGGGAFGPGGLGGSYQQQQQQQADVLGQAKQAYTDASTTGGYDPTQLAALRANQAGFAATGGFDPTKLASVESGYQNFADTGGFSEADKTAFLNRATEGIPGIYKTMMQQAQTGRDATGGLGTGGDISQMARQLSQAQAEGTLNAQTDLASQIRQGKMAGLGGLESTISDVAGRRLAGGAQQAGTEASVAAGKLGAAAGMKGLYDSVSGNISDTGNKILASYGLSDASNAMKLQVLDHLANTPGPLADTLGIISTLSGAAKNVGVGLGG